MSFAPASMVRRIAAALHASMHGGGRVFDPWQTRRFLSRVRQRAGARRLAEMRLIYGDAARFRVGTLRLEILHVGREAAGVLSAIMRWSREDGLDVRLISVDCGTEDSFIAALAADDRAVQGSAGHLTGSGGRGWDAVIATLAVQERTRDDTIALIRFMEAEARIGWLINDLKPDSMPLTEAAQPSATQQRPEDLRDGQFLCSPDIRREWQLLLNEAGARTARVFGAFPFRVGVERLHDGERLMVDTNHDRPLNPIVS